MKVFDATRDHADLVIILGNGRRPEEERRRVGELGSDPAMPGPTCMNEDDHRPGSSYAASEPV